MKVLLIVAALFANGTREDVIIVTDSYDECYVEGMNQTDKYEKMPDIVMLELSCEKT